ncbi:hypothetical protein KC717_04815 [Candidatus Dojkabacteria bacterium]|uniref:Uncharacterized protein n=1 Tax=Candidatus Dojkabacteria bacterium TaxID=2099670 RepID=A0A955L963_9BACT|nr:hypothetical protein [Candidatus Dojkabacteria bacterium]
MDESISYTLESIRCLKSPVIRTCHIGNISSNNYGWLALARNTKFSCIDHTLYGVDDEYFGWCVLDDGGVIRRWFDHGGKAVEEFRNNLVYDYLDSIPRKYKSILNMSIGAKCHGKNIFHYHFQKISEVCNQIGVHEPSSRSIDSLKGISLLNETILNKLNPSEFLLLFDRWVTMTKNQHYIIHKIKEIKHDSNHIVVFGMDNARLFRGTVEELLLNLRKGLDSISRHILADEELEKVSYPMFSSIFGNYLLPSAIEFERDSAQRTFYHAGAATTPYYTNESQFRNQFAEVVELLQKYKLLPEKYCLKIIPSMGCQLFSTTTRSMNVLSELLSCVVGIVREKDDIYKLGDVTNPEEIVVEVLNSINKKEKGEIVRLIDKFNELDTNTIPVSLKLNGGKTRFGTTQETLCGRTFLFPDEIFEITWGELEMVHKLLSEIY